MPSEELSSIFSVVRQFRGPDRDRVDEAFQQLLEEHERNARKERNAAPQPEPQPQPQPEPALPAPADPPYPTCSGTTLAGQPCNFPARRDTGLCINHDPTYRDQQRQNTLKGVRASVEVRKLTPILLTDINLTDRAELQALLETIVHLELQGRISTARARNLIRIVSLAIKNLGHSPHGWIRDRDRHHFDRYMSSRMRLNRILPPVLDSQPQDPEA